MTDIQMLALTVIEPDSQMTASDVARRLWPNSDRVKYISAGAIIKQLAKRGLVCHQYPRGTGLRVWRRTAEGTKLFQKHFAELERQRSSHEH